MLSAPKKHGVLSIILGASEIGLHHHKARGITPPFFSPKMYSLAMAPLLAKGFTLGPSMKKKSLMFATLAACAAVDRKGDISGSSETWLYPAPALPLAITPSEEEI